MCHPKKSSVKSKEIYSAKRPYFQLFVSYPRFSPIGVIVDDAFKEHGEVLKADVEVHYCYTACKLVNAGVGVAIVDEFSLLGQDLPNM